MLSRLDCIMLIDDNEDDNFFHQIILNEINAAQHIQVAESGFEALEYLQKGIQLPQLIFLDINMPKMNGWEFLDEYEKLSEKNKISAVIIMLTTSFNPYDKEKAKSRRLVNGFESKPLTEEILRRVFASFFQE